MPTLALVVITLLIATGSVAALYLIRCTAINVDYALQRRARAAVATTKPHAAELANTLAVMRGAYRRLADAGGDPRCVVLDASPGLRSTSRVVARAWRPAPPHIRRPWPTDQTYDPLTSPYREVELADTPTTRIDREA